MMGRHFLVNYLSILRSRWDAIFCIAFNLLKTDSRYCLISRSRVNGIFSARHFWVATFLLLSMETSAMAFFNPLKTCVFSEVSARVFLNGEPVRGAKVVRKWNWHKERYDESITDVNGYVSFPPKYESSITRLLPAELVIGQQLSVFIEGEETIFWSNAKREPEINAEYGGNPFRIACELTNEEVLIESYGSLMLTMCTLDGKL